MAKQILYLFDKKHGKQERMLPRITASLLNTSYHAVHEDYIIKCINKLDAKHKVFPTVCIDENKIDLHKLKHSVLCKYSIFDI